jgi:hypothetical protein
MRYRGLAKNTAQLHTLSYNPQLQKSVETGDADG